MTGTVPGNWDLEVDFLSIGAGIGGLAGAITAHEYGLRSAVLEKSDKLGGVTAFSFGQIWVAGNQLATGLGIEDTPARAYRYVQWLGMGYSNADLARSYCANAPLALKFFADTAGVRWRLIRDFADYYWPKGDGTLREGRFLEVAPFPGASLGNWQERTRLSPHVPHGMTHEDMFGRGGAANILNWDFELMRQRLSNDERCLGPGLAASFAKGLIDRDIPAYVSTAVKELITEGGRVVGVRAEREGRSFYVRTSKGVLVACSGYDWNTEFKQYYDHQIECVSAVPGSVTGDHLVFAGRLGAKLAQIPYPSNLGFRVPGEEHEGRPLWRLGLTSIGLPHAILVNRRGRRFADEAFYRAACYAASYIDGGSQTRPNYPCWGIVDSQFHERYALGPIMPGQDVPDGFAVKADSLRDLAARTGIDADGLEAEVATFNNYARQGKDPQFLRGEKAWSNYMCGDLNHRPNPNMGTLEQPPFYAVQFFGVGTGTGSAGLAADPDGRVLNYDNQPIAGLYAAGNSMAMLDVGAGYQSGMANGRGMIFGYLAARHAAGEPSLELEKARPAMP